MIKRIQLRGISSTPSDRNNVDGGCAESLNLFVDQNELATIQTPSDSGRLTSPYPVRYIHKTAHYENYVAVNGTNVELYTRSGHALSQNIEDVPRSFSHIGNTLMVSTSEHLHYFLYKEGSYSYLGTRIYEPLVNFSVQPMGSDGGGIEQEAYISAEDIRSNATDPENRAVSSVLYNGEDNPLTASKWQKILKNRTAQAGIAQDIIDLKGEDLAYAIESRVWERVASMMTANRAQGVFSRPVMARAAVKLYDGSYIYHTEPFLMGQGSNQWLDVWRMPHAHEDGTDDTIDVGQGKYTRIKITIAELFKAKYSVKCSMAELAKWEDIIQGVDIFLSEDICNPHPSSDLAGVHIPISETSFHFYFEGQDGMGNPKDIRDEILGKGNFYKVESIPFSQLTASMEEDLEPKSQDDLLVQTVLPLDTLSHHESYPMGPMTAYNERIVYSGLGQNIYAGSPSVQSAIDDGSVSHTYKTKYYLHTINGDIATNGRTFTEKSLFGALLFYPDPRCYQVDIQKDGITYRIPMEDHPSLNGSYALVSLDKSVLTAGTVVTGDFTYQPKMEDESRLVMSEAANPFLLPTTGRLTFDSKVLKVCTVTAALSTNRNGMFPYYVFTESGIWSVEINDDGTFRTQPQAVSRDVALSEKSITPIDNAIVFSTTRGVMLLQGSQVTNLSPNDHGDRYVIDEETAAMLSGTIWEKYLAILRDTTPFLEYIPDAETLYDYSGSRLVLVNAAKPYQYVYQLAEGTWHKMARLDSELYVGMLNSYPEALATVYRDGQYRIYDFGHPTHVSNGVRLPAVTITRGLDFDSPFTRKSVSRIFVRGYRKLLASDSTQTVQYVLLASQDGVSYAPLHSLRGKSYHFYRLMILTNLLPEERITFVEVDEDERFLNRIR